MPLSSITGNILIIDDTPMNVLVLSKLLTDNGYKVQAETNSNKGLEIAFASPPDLILLDIVMPDLNGYDVCKELKSHPATADIPVIFLSALDHTEDKVRGFSVGAIDFITKPFQPEEVLVRVRTHLSLQITRRELMKTNNELKYALLREKMLNDFSRALGRSLDGNILIDTITSLAPELIGAESCELGILNEDGITLNRVYPPDKPGGNALSMHSDDDSSMAELWEFLGSGSPRLIETRQVKANWSKPLEEAGITWIMLVPLVLVETRLGVLILTSTKPQNIFSKRELNLAESLGRLAAMAVQNARLFEHSQHLANTDGLTGLNNRRHFYDLASQEIGKARRYKMPLSMIMLDIDFFKKVNDTYGHTCGDDVLRNVANCVQSNIRTVDIHGRYGGEEFVVLLPFTTAEQACILAERLRYRVAEIITRSEAQEINVTISLGIAGYHLDGSDTLEELLKRADEALYSAKSNGRNCFVCID
ncbi:MAG: diguanylate cyclase [Candidatus Saccharibacteria bacterium]